jgi:hypothetical protein
MWNEPTKERLSKIPRLYETEHTQIQDKLIYLHFFIGGCDWFICEYDGEDIFFGFAILNNDLQNAEWGYVSFSELKKLKMKGFVEVDCEYESVWRVCRAAEVEKISIAHGWPVSSPKKENKRKVVIRGDALLAIKGPNVIELQRQLASGQLSLSEIRKQLFIFDINESISQILKYYSVDPNSVDEVSDFVLSVFTQQHQSN